MPRRPRPAATTSTLARNPDLGAEDGTEADVDAAHDGTWDGPAEEAAAVTAQHAAENADADDIRREGATSTPTRQLTHPATEAPVMASHPPPVEALQPRRRPAPGRTRSPRAPATPPALALVPTPSVPVEPAALTDAELQDLGALTRLALRFDVPIADLVFDLEAMLAAYRKARGA